MVFRRAGRERWERREKKEKKFAPKMCQALSIDSSIYLYFTDQEAEAQKLGN